MTPDGYAANGFGRAVSRGTQGHYARPAYKVIVATLNAPVTVAGWPKGWGCTVWQHPFCMALPVRKSCGIHHCRKSSGTARAMLGE